MRLKSSLAVFAAVLVVQLAGPIHPTLAQEVDPAPELVQLDDAVTPDAAPADDAAPPADAPAVTPTATPEVTPAATPQATPSPTPLPAATAAPLPSYPTYNTRNGPRTQAQIQQELAAAGYAGPWDLDSMLAAYAGVKTATPAPAPVTTPNPLVAECTAIASDVASLQKPLEDGQLAVAARNPAGIRAVAAGVRSRKYTSGALPLVNAYLRFLDAAAAEADILQGWPLLTLESQQPGGALIMAAAQADLNRVQSAEQVALVEFQQATRDLTAHCSGS